ncbi:MAG: hypothetical protein Q4C00_06690 [Bacillota bacterium]|nr:hypothetical protein [Bacillota bacterium]
MSNDFSYAACVRYDTVANFRNNPTAANNATAYLTKRTQRAIAGMLYRFLVDTGRAN